ncbi:MAG: hypothetical protein GW946_02975 [Candidatus Pacebacteria bacterium]|nr:hypothetical protein [Candidatus Paceibacterota bacterium]PIR60330.1 MAG: hypothetical protein COU67_02550 [Candidatus Pacebacteria bacterium CG10_big_fil_rev_8_21_14_0_10_44_54]
MPLPTAVKIKGIIIILLLLVSGGMWMFSLFPNNKQGSQAQPITLKQISDLPSINDPQASPFATLALLPAQAGSLIPYEVSVGQSAKVNIVLQSSLAGEVIDGVELQIRFDPTALANLRLEPSHAFSSVVHQSVRQEEGIITLALVREPEEVVSSDTNIVLGLISFTPRVAGETTLGFTTAATLVAGNQGQNVLEQTKDLMVQIR